MHDKSKRSLNRIKHCILLLASVFMIYQPIACVNWRDYLPLSMQSFKVKTPSQSHKSITDFLWRNYVIIGGVAAVAALIAASLWYNKSPGPASENPKSRKPLSLLSGVDQQNQLEKQIDEIIQRDNVKEIVNMLDTIYALYGSSAHRTPWEHIKNFHSFIAFLLDNPTMTKEQLIEAIESGSDDSMLCYVFAKEIQIAGALNTPLGNTYVKLLLHLAKKLKCKGDPIVTFESSQAISSNTNIPQLIHILDILYAIQRWDEKDFHTYFSQKALRQAMEKQYLITFFNTKSSGVQTALSQEIKSIPSKKQSEYFLNDSDALVIINILNRLIELTKPQ